MDCDVAHKAVPLYPIHDGRGAHKGQIIKYLFGSFLSNIIYKDAHLIGARATHSQREHQHSIRA